MQESRDGEDMFLLGLLCEREEKRLMKDWSAESVRKKWMGDSSIR